MMMAMTIMDDYDNDSHTNLLNDEHANINTNNNTTNNVIAATITNTTIK